MDTVETLFPNISLGLQALSRLASTVHRDLYECGITMNYAVVNVPLHFTNEKVTSV